MVISTTTKLSHRNKHHSTANCAFSPCGGGFFFSRQQNSPQGPFQKYCPFPSKTQSKLEHQVMRQPSLAFYISFLAYVIINHKL